MPRIRHLKHLTLYAPRERFALEHMAHIRELLTGTMHWGLITTHLPDMLREALSISQGKVRASTIPRKLGTERMLIQHGDRPDEERLQITVYRTRSLSVLSVTEQLRHLPGVREIRHTVS